MAVDWKEMLKKARAVITLLVFVSLIFLFFDASIHRQLFSQKYGINPAQLTVILVIAEIIFNLGIIIMLRASGIFKMTIIQIVKFDFKKVRFQFNNFFLGFFLNRIAAAFPWAYVLIIGWRKLPIGLSSLLIAELIVVVLITFSVIEVSKNGLSTS